MENRYEQINLEKLRAHLSECAVLLKKDGKFPLKQACDLAAYGNGVRRTIKGGTGSGEVNSRYFISIEEGLKQCGFNITTRQWLDEYDEVFLKAREDFIKGVKQQAKQQHTHPIIASMGAIMTEPEYDLKLDHDGDACIYVLSRISGEGSDRRYIKGDIELTDSEIRDIRDLNEHYDRFMLVINAGGPVDLSPVNDVGNILVLSQLGVETGLVLGKILLGESPSGKLTTTWAAGENYYSDTDFGNRDDTRYKEGIYVGYRYFTSFDAMALYPFGYGLSYSEFELGQSEVRIDRTAVNIAVDIRNVGAYDAKETVQAYISKPSTRQDEPKYELISFAKSDLLKPEGSQKLNICFDFRDLSSYDEKDQEYYLPQGQYGLYIGTSLADLKLIRVIELDEEAVTRKVRNAFRKTDFSDLTRETGDERYSGVEVMKIDPSLFDCEQTVYDKQIRIDDRVNDLSDEQLMYLSIGSFSEKKGLLGMIGNASSSVAGAAGETTLKLRDAGIPNIVMADGPAGIRIAKDYYKDEDGAHSLGLAIPESMLMFLPGWQKKLLSLFNRRPKNIKIEHHYATAIPIGTAIAQSFNTEFAEMCGDIVGSEMEEFDIDLWLAPALNIHRDIRCGRNFEYFSEDPLLSGKMAAALTRGVQKHTGKGVTIKHFCCNNQETNRTLNNSMVSERAIRQIYLKGFEICIKESDPAAVMSSYNLINGEHTNEKRELITDILYDEFAFNGMVMTDWVINHGSYVKSDGYDGAYSYNVVMSGNALFMPGSMDDFLELKDAFTSGKVTRRQLEENATRILKTIDRLKNGKEG